MCTLEKLIGEEPDIHQTFLPAVENYLKLVSYSEGLGATRAGGVMPFISYVSFHGSGSPKESARLCLAPTSYGPLEFEGDLPQSCGAPQIFSGKDESPSPTKPSTEKDNPQYVNFVVI